MTINLPPQPNPFRLIFPSLAVAVALMLTGCSLIRDRQPPPASSFVRDGPPLTAADGYIEDGDLLSPFDTSHAAIANLDPDLLQAVQQAATDAGNQGVSMLISAGWRSARYQEALMGQALVRYGSEEEASRWVSTPEKSAHVTGDAVDILPTDADSWLSQHGSGYGLCQTYANEMWHFELAIEPGGDCPPQLSDASEG